MKKILVATAAVALGIGGYLACDTEDEPQEFTSELQIRLRPVADAPLRDNPSQTPSQLLLVVGGVSARHAELGWLDNVWATAAIDLLAPEESIPQILGAAPLPEGEYDQLRFDVVYAGVELDRKWYPVEIPSGESSGLKVNTHFCIVEGLTASLELEWNVDQALHYSEGRGYWLDPMLQVDNTLATCLVD